MNVDALHDSVHPRFVQDRSGVCADFLHACRDAGAGAHHVVLDGG